MIRKLFSQLTPVITSYLPLALCVCALHIVYNECKTQDLSALWVSLNTTPFLGILAAISLTAVNYLILALYDCLALRYSGHHQIPIAKIAPAAMLGYAISNNTGYAWAAGGSIRFRFYAKWGVLGWDMLRISLFETVTYLLGAFSLGLLGSLILPHYLLTNPNQDSQLLHVVSLTCTAFLIIYWGAIWGWRKPMCIKGVVINLPSLRMAACQTLIASIDIIVSAFVLWALLPEQTPIHFGIFLIVFVVAQALGFVSQVPGGLGVFESAFLWLMSDIAGSDQHLALMGALLLYRVIYYFIPLALAGTGLFAYEMFTHRAVLKSSGRTIYNMLLLFVPKPYRIILPFIGITLYNAEAISANLKPATWLHDLTPLTVLLVCFGLSSVMGLGLVIVAQGANLTFNSAHDRRLRSRTNFKSAVIAWGKHLLHNAVNRYIALFTGVTALITVMPEDHRIIAWWRLFTEQSTAPTITQASWSIAVLTTTLVLHRHLNFTAPKSLIKPSTYELNAAALVIQQSEDTRGYLAFLGDKYLHWSEDRTAFIMFEATPNFWIAMGDPIGNQHAVTQLLWSFREQAHQYGAKAVFYQVSPAFLPDYLELGLNFYKLGEEAKIDLTTFNLQGRSRSSQRGIRNRLTKQGFQFSIVSQDQVKPLLPELREISNRWLTAKNTGEKSFSLGFYDDAYLCRTDIAIVRNEQYEIVAFANILKSANNQELSFDLMRYNPDIKGGIMEFLLVELMLWGQAQHYRWFLMGMAPLAGLKRHPLAPMWHKVGTVIFHHAEAFYNFEGLYHYKEKYDPVWEPRYLAAYSKCSIPLILLLITRLISRSWKGIFSRS